MTIAPRVIELVKIATDFLPCRPRSGDFKLNGLDHVAHEATAVPVWLGRLDLTLRIDAAHLQAQHSGLRRRDLRTPLAKAVRALVAAQRGRLPVASAVGRQLYT